jgi:hypothetical protein
VVSAWVGCMLDAWSKDDQIKLFNYPGLSVFCTAIYAVRGTRERKESQEREDIFFILLQEVKL